MLVSYRYHFWKDHLGEFKTAKGDKLTVNKGVDHGFRAGLKLMEDAMALGVNAPNKLHKPVFSPLSGQDAINKKSKHSKTAGTQPVQVATDQEVTFRSIAESYAGEHNLLFIPTGRSHAGTGKQLFKVAKSLDGRGVTVYVGQDAVYAQVQDDTFRAVLLDDMVKMAGI
jgi:tuftelin-interacting protein 11